MHDKSLKSISVWMPRLTVSQLYDIYDEVTDGKLGSSREERVNRELNESNHESTCLRLSDNNIIDEFYDVRPDRVST